MGSQLIPLKHWLSHFNIPENTGRLLTSLLDLFPEFNLRRGLRTFLSQGPGAASAASPGTTLRTTVLKMWCEILVLPISHFWG